MTASWSRSTLINTPSLRQRDWPIDAIFRVHRLTIDRIETGAKFGAFRKLSCIKLQAQQISSRDDVKVLLVARGFKKILRPDVNGLGAIIGVVQGQRHLTNRLGPIALRIEELHPGFENDPAGLRFGCQTRERVNRHG